MITKRKLRKIARAAARVAAQRPDPALAVSEAFATATRIGVNPADLRISVSRPAVKGKPASVTVRAGRRTVTETQDVER